MTVAPLISNWEDSSTDASPKTASKLPDDGKPNRARLNIEVGVRGIGARTAAQQTSAVGHVVSKERERPSIISSSEPQVCLGVGRVIRPRRGRHKCAETISNIAL